MLLQMILYAFYLVVNLNLLMLKLMKGIYTKGEFQILLERGWIVISKVFCVPLKDLVLEH